MGKEIITFADLSGFILEVFKVLEDKIDSKLESYHKELHKLVWESITYDNLDNRDPPQSLATLNN